MSRYIDMDGGSEAPLVTGHTKPITCLALPPSDATPLMATTCQDGILRIWHMPSTAADWHQVFHPRLCIATIHSSVDNLH